VLIREAIITIGVFVSLLPSFRTIADESVHKSTGGPTLSTLPSEDLKSLPYMCECEFYRRPIHGETMVFATRKERVGFVVVDGHLMTLQRDGKPADTRCRKNARYQERWVSSTTAIVLDQRVTGSGVESCWYKGKLHVTVDGRVVSIPISGACGC